MGSNDESSNDIEQGEKILFYYPPETPLYQQLSKITMIEGLIEFSNKFSSDPIDTVVMEKNTWGFYQCDPDLWIVIAIENGCSPISPELPGSPLRHSPNGVGIQNAIKKLYSIFSSFHSSLLSLLTAGGSGWALIDHVRTVRKSIRKLAQGISQIERDIESTRRFLEPSSPSPLQEEQEQEPPQQKSSEVTAVIGSEAPEGKEEEQDEAIEEAAEASLEEQTKRESFLQQKLLSLQELEASLASIREQIVFKELELQRLLDHPHYTPRDVRKHLSTYMTWYLHTGELISPSGITGLWGMHFSPSGFPNFHTIHSIRQSLSAQLQFPESPQILGCTILCEGQVVWNDFLDCDILCLYEYIRLKETMKIREQACALSRHLPNGNGSGSGGSSGGEIKLFRSQTTSDLDDSEGGDSSQLTGTAAAGSGTGGVTEQEIAMPSVRKKQLSFPSVGVRRSSNAELMRRQQSVLETTAKAIRERKGFLRSGWDILDFSQIDPTETGFETSPDDEMELMCEGPGRVWCPRIHISADTNALLTEQQQQLQLQRHGQGQGQGQGITATGHPLISSLFSAHPSSSLLAPDPVDPRVNTSATTTTRICLGRGVLYREDSFHVLVLLQDWEETPAPVSTSAFASETSPSPSQSHSHSHHLNQNQSRVQLSSAQLQLLLTELQTRLSSAISLSRETQSPPFPLKGTAKPIRSPVAGGPTGGAGAGGGTTAEILDCVGFIYSNDCNTAFKAANLNRSPLSPLLSWPSPLPSSCHSIVPLLISRSATSASVSRLRFPSSTSQVSSCLSPPIMAAISDALCSISGELTQRGHVKEACLRVSSVQRGGVWVLARRLGERTVVFVIESCHTLNEMHELVNRTSDSILANIMI